MMQFNPNRPAFTSEKIKGDIRGNTLTTLDYRGLNLGDGEVSWIASSWYYSETIDTIILSKNNISDWGVCVLADALERNPILKTLSIAENLFEEAGLVRLAELKKNLPGLEILGVDLSPGRVSKAQETLKIAEQKEAERQSRLKQYYERTLSLA